MSMGQTGHKPGGVPPKFFMFIGFSFPIGKEGLFPRLRGLLKKVVLIVHFKKKLDTDL